MFQEQGFIKFKINDYVATVHYLNRDGVLHFLTESDSNKVNQFIENSDVITAGDGMKATEFYPVSVNLIDNQDDVKKLYDEMTELKFNHFKDYDDNLVKYEVKY